jgi:hypothetical protein
MPDVVLLSDSPNLQKAVANKHIIKYPSKADGKNSLDNFSVRMNAGVKDNGYQGYFRLENISDETGYKVICHGGWCDLGSLQSKTFIISEGFCQIHLLAEYIKDNETTGHYQVSLTNNWNNDKVSNEFATWLIGDVTAEKDSSGNLQIKVVQQWQNGEIYFGSRYWI